ncbi:hypothetical protein [Streptomyces naphthomycinicus]|uniref:hypothetical protein n=1 Tax=Streptomyces naphthomycinicus TaxID=2872625 RepID=UPI001CEC0F91|nr:hypothetical protein [Streptomyces sp. TML10]
MEAADRLPGERNDRHERYRTWSLHPDSADALLQTLLALSIHSLIVDAVAGQETGTAGLVERLRIADIAWAAAERPSHELLAGLPPLPDDDRQRVNAVNIMIYDDASALTLGRLTQMIRIMLRQLTAAQRVTDPLCSDIADD